jgi:hypothetical protein
VRGRYRIIFLVFFLAFSTTLMALVDWGIGGIFALGNVQMIAGVFAPYVRLAGLHDPSGGQIYLNAAAIDAVLVDHPYAGACVAVVAEAFSNPRVPKGIAYPSWKLSTWLQPPLIVL